MYIVGNELTSDTSYYPKTLLYGLVGVHGHQLNDIKLIYRARS